MNQDARDALAAIIAVAVGFACIVIGLGGDLQLASLLASVMGAFGSTAREVDS